MKIQILYGTESGNAELVATDVFESLEDKYEVLLDDLAEFDVEAMEPATLHLVFCSTHGEGELPQSAVPFADRIQASRPDLSGVRYVMFGLGDSTYPYYSRGSEHLDALLTSLGAKRIGTYGRHDAASRADASELAQDWAKAALKFEFEHDLQRARA